MCGGPPRDAKETAGNCFPAVLEEQLLTSVYGNSNWKNCAPPEMGSVT